ncbi:MAG: hypothetical protein ACC618_00715 [Patescibacteria group bacterium]
MPAKNSVPLSLRVLNRQDILYEGDISSLSSFNDKGKFDVLPKHANFISLVSGQLVARDLKGKEKVIELGSGIMKVSGNKINVYMGTRQKT